jgi:hypothetical protein
MRSLIRPHLEQMRDHQDKLNRRALFPILYSAQIGVIGVAKRGGQPLQRHALPLA